ncbi:non-ribosomal peptide synthetase, partial [Actinophytocola sediminis]
ARHDALRTTLRADEDGTVWQTVHPWRAPDLPAVDLPDGDLEAGYWRELGAPFDLGAPLVRFVLARLAADDAALLVCAHHAVVDGWSMGVLGRELAELYRAATEDRPALDQPATPVSPAAPDDSAYWRAAMAGAPVLDLPTDRPRANRPGPPAGHVPVTLPAALTGGLRALAEDAGTTLHTVLVAGFSAVLSRWSGRADLVFGSFVANRDQPGTERLVGFRARVLPLRVRTGGVGTFRELVGRARTSCLDTLAHQETPLSTVLTALGQDHRGTTGSPVRVAFGLRPATPGWTAPGLRATPFEIPAAAAQFELSVELAETGDGGLTGRATFAADLYDESTVARLATGFTRLLAEVAADPDRRLGDLPAEPATERAHLERWSDPHQEQGDPVPAHHLVESRVDSAPDAVALDAHDGRLTYRELDRRANQLAAHLRAAGVEPGQLVAVHLSHSAACVVALLAILKAGAVYLPLDADYPAAQLGLAVRDARPAVVVTRAGDGQAEVLAALAETGARLVTLDTEAAAIAARPAGRVPVTVAQDDLAYVIYTSGSTGRPKGTANTHRGLANHTRWRAATFPLAPGEGVLHRTPLGFDISITEIFWPLVTGARLVVPPPEVRRDPGRWAEFCRAHRVGHTYFVPSVLKVFLAEHDGAANPFTQLHLIGERLTGELVAATRDALPGVTIHNVYGPAETAMEVTHDHVHGSREPVSIGRPIPGIRCYVLDDRATPVPIGVTGELYLAGAGLARGYLGQPAMTATRFVADPFRDGERMYRTGDRARWLPDGRLDCLGRVDDQVKIRGQRVEIGGVEAELGAVAGVRAAAVVAASAPDGDRILVAYVVSDLPVEDLRAAMLARVPEMMVPHTFVPVPEIPLNPSGKTDRSALPAPDLAARADYRPPGPGVEQALAEIWSTVLGVPRIGRDDEFRELGGHSLMATRLAARIRSGFGIEVSVVELLERRWTLAELAGELRRRQLAQADRDDLRDMLARIAALPDAEVAGLLGEGRTDDAQL